MAHYIADQRVVFCLGADGKRILVWQRGCQKKDLEFNHENYTSRSQDILIRGTISYDSILFLVFVKSTVTFRVPFSNKVTTSACHYILYIVRDLKHVLTFFAHWAHVEYHQSLPTSRISTSWGNSFAMGPRKRYAVRNLSLWVPSDICTIRTHVLSHIFLRTRVVTRYIDRCYVSLYSGHELGNQIMSSAFETELDLKMRSGSLQHLKITVLISCWFRWT